MTRKDYVALANRFAQHAPSDSPEGAFSKGAKGMWLVLRSEIADALAADNPRFDRERFYCACRGCDK